MEERRNLNQFEYSKYLTMPPLRRLSSDFNLCADDITASMALQRYIKDEFTNPPQNDDLRDVYADKLLFTLKDQGTLPSDEPYAEEPDDAADLYRIGFFKSILPLQANLRESDEFEQWLPDAFNFILPPDGRHQTDVCLRDGALSEETCYIADTCPIKVVLKAVRTELKSSDFLSYDYRVDADKAFRTRVLLLGHVASRDFLLPYSKSVLENKYQNRFAAAFPSSR